MGWAFSTQKQIKKTRKPHKCICCREIIPIGKSCLYVDGKFDGDFISYYLCQTCNDIYDKFDLDWSDNIGDFGDELSNIVWDRKCKCGKRLNLEDWSIQGNTITVMCDGCDYTYTGPLDEFLGLERGAE